MLKKMFSIAALMLMLGACSNGSKADAADPSSVANDTIPDMEQTTQPTGPKVEVKTTAGDFVVMLYDDTPQHRDNFLKLVDEQFYDSTLFHRVINQFMVQAGDPNSKEARPGKMLGDGDPGYTIPAEIVYPKHYHKRGVLAAARTGDQINPERRSSGSQFYIVTGRKADRGQLKAMQVQMAFQQLQEQYKDEIMDLRRERDRNGLMALQERMQNEARQMVAQGKSPITDEMIEVYATEGGAPHLDGQYTVFGEVISGMDTIDKIEKAQTDRNDRPLDDIRILSMKRID